MIFYVVSVEEIILQIISEEDLELSIRERQGIIIIFSIYLCVLTN